jgi:hypothetical protein
LLAIRYYLYSMKQILLLIFISLPITLFAQATKDSNRVAKVVQFSGLVLTSDSLQPLPYAVIYDKTKHQGTYTNALGFFSFAAAEGDSIIFSYIGYKKKSFQIPIQLTADKYNMVQLMSTDTVYLAATVIHPYPRPEELKQAVLNLKLPNDDMERARKNIARMSTPEIKMSVPVDGREASTMVLRNQASTYYYRGQTPPQNIFNPIAWSQFFEAWKRGDYKNKN